MLHAGAFVCSHAGIAKPPLCVIDVGETSGPSQRDVILLTRGTCAHLSQKPCNIATCACEAPAEVPAARLPRRGAPSFLASAIRLTERCRVHLRAMEQCGWLGCRIARHHLLRGLHATDCLAAYEVVTVLVPGRAASGAFALCIHWPTHAHHIACLREAGCRRHSGPPDATFPVARFRVGACAQWTTTPATQSRKTLPGGHARHRAVSIGHQQSSSPAVIPVQSLTHLPRSSLLAAHHSLELRRFVRRCMERAQSGASTGTSDFFEGTPPLVCEADVKQQARKRLRALRCSWLNRLVGALQQLSSFLQQHGWRASCEVRRRAHLCSERCLPRSSTLACCLRTQKASGSVTPRGRRVVCVTSGCVPAGTDFVDALAPSLPAGALTRSSNAEALRHARAAAQRHHRATRTALCALPRQFQRRNTRRSLDRVRRRMMDVTLTPYDSRQQLC